ncbi:MAG: AMP-binding protein [Eubacterium sp.]|nr:AMP-binding protein [Eubacterium sp.]
MWEVGKECVGADQRFDHYWYKDITDETTVKGMLASSTQKYPDNPAFWVKAARGKEYVPISYTLLQHDVNALGNKILKMGLAGERIAIMGQNCYEWIATYLAVICGAGLVVPIDKELSGPEIGNLMRASDSHTIFCTRAECKKLKGLPMVKNLVVMEFYGDRTDIAEAPQPTGLDPAKYQDLFEQEVNVYDWRQLLAEADSDEGDFASIEIDPDALAVILFTSGTTGNPKGVMLSNRNIMINIMDVCRIAHILPTDKTLSMLPIHHTYECTLGMLLVLYRGASTAFCEGLKYISKNMKEAHNTVIIVVPRVLEVVYGRIAKGIEESGKQKLFDRMMKLNRALRKSGINISRKIFKSVLDELGGELRIVVTGAAALAPNICRAFEDFGVIVLQGYGMTECTPLISGTPMSADRERYRKAGSVGVPVMTGSVRIDDADADGIGEVMFKGPNVMLGYYNMPEETAEVMEPDGWMHTGDLGFLDNEGWLHLTGRKKNIIVTKTGENVYPEEIEDLINAHPFVAECMVFPYINREGENKEEIVGVQIFPDKAAIKEELGYEPTYEELTDRFQEIVREINIQMPVYKRIRFTHVRKEDFVRTTTLKIRRQDNMM